MRASIEGDSEGGRTELCVVSRQAVVTDATNGDGVDAGGVAIAVAIVVRQSAIARRPNIDVAFAVSSLQQNQPSLGKYAK